MIWVLMIIKYLNRPLGGGFRIYKNNLGRLHQILLSWYLREELKRRTWGRGLSKEGPMGSCWVIVFCSVMAQKIKPKAKIKWDS